MDSISAMVYYFMWLVTIVWVLKTFAWDGLKGK